MNEYSPDERKELLALAHKALRARIFGQKLEVPEVSARLREFRGAFTTLHLRGKLRGCIGYVMANQPLFQTVLETAAAAATEDPRFSPVNEVEAGELQIEISVLSPMFPIRAEDIEIGKHGLMISQFSRRGLLLPQVAKQWNLDRETFLAQACAKAGLPMDAWKHGATIEAFTAEVFGETAPGESLAQ